MLGHGRGVDEDMLGESVYIVSIERGYKIGRQLQMLTWVLGRPCWRL